MFYQNKYWGLIDHYAPRLEELKSAIDSADVGAIHEVFSDRDFMRFLRYNPGDPNWSCSILDREILPRATRTLEDTFRSREIVDILIAKGANPNAVAGSYSLSGPYSASMEPVYAYDAYGVEDASSVRFATMPTTPLNNYAHELYDKKQRPNNIVKQLIGWSVAGALTLAVVMCSAAVAEADCDHDPQATDCASPKPPRP